MKRLHETQVERFFPTVRPYLTEWMIHFCPIQIVFHSIFSKLQPLVTERIAKPR